MLGSILAFELRFALRKPAFWWISAAYFLFGLFYLSSSVAGSALSSSAVNVNAPWAITRMVVHLSYLGLLGVAAFSGSSVIRDFSTGTASTLFCTRLGKPAYVLGRFLGGYLAALLSFSFVFLGLIAGNFAPWADPRLLGPFPAEGLLAAFVLFAAPNLLVACCVLFSIALLTRDTMRTYVGAVAILIGFLVSRAFAGAFYTTRDAQVIASLAEPFGAYAAMMAVLDWTPYERNTIPVMTQALIGHNRVLWVLVGGVLLLLAYLRFPFQVVGPAKARRGRKIGAAPFRDTPAFSQGAEGGNVWVEAERNAGVGAGTLSSVGQLANLAAFETRRIVRSAPFAIITGLSCVGLLFWVVMYGRAYGTGFYPYTAQMASHVSTVFQIPLIAVLVFYAADLVWASRLRQADELLDACPASNAVRFFSKLTALFAVATVLLLCGVAAAVGYQLFRGFWAIDVGVYATHILLVSLPSFFIMATLALVLQAMSGNRFVGMLAMVAVFVFTLVAPELGVRSNLLIPAGRHAVHYNALAGFGHYLEPIVWSQAYWLLLAGLLSVLGSLAWQRGKETAFRKRFAAIRDGMKRGPALAAAGALTVAIVGVGAVFAYHAEVRNPVPSQAQREAKAVAYERRYGELRGLAQPDIEHVEGELRLFPETRHLAFAGSYRLINDGDTAISRVVLTARPGTRFTEVRTDRSARSDRDRRHGVVQLHLAAPLEPGERMDVAFALQSPPIRGFRNRAQRTPVAYDGSLVFHNDFLPELGYARSRELSDDLAREEHGLPDRPSGVRDAGDPRGLTEREGQLYADWVSFDLLISTDADQRVVAQGELVEHRIEGGRASFRYVTRVPVKLHAGIVSGRYVVTEEVYHGLERPIRIAIHHMPGHGRNVPRLMASLRRSLETMEQAFGPYPYGRLKLVEVAMDRPTFRVRSDTLLGDSSLGFINDPRLDDPRSPPSFLVKLPASMVANLYVQSIVLAANQPGATSIPDGLGFYLSSLVWVEREHPFDIAETIRDTAWHYFNRRTTADEPEGTIVDHVNQTHVGAHKNAVAMYGLDLYLGRGRMIRAIRGFLQKHRFKGPPFARMSDLVGAFRAEAPEAVQPIITDFFERRTLFDIAATAASVERTRDGRYRIEVETRAEKKYLSANGKPRKVAFDVPVPLVAFGERIDSAGARRILARVMVSPRDLADGHAVLVTDEKPVMVGLDPFYRLLDRKYLDNRTWLD